MNKIVIVAAFVAAGLPQLASAQPPLPEQARAVSYADLDLSREKGVRILDRRIAQAVKQVCGVASDVDVRGKNEVRRCRALTNASLAGKRDRALASAAASTQIAIASVR
jgi:UrcA family protein